MTSPSGTLYTGMTSNLVRRVYEHKQRLVDGFTKKYNITRLAYYEQISDVQTALAREKEIKKWRLRSRCWWCTSPSSGRSLWGAEPAAMSRLEAIPVDDCPGVDVSELALAEIWTEGPA